MGNAIGWCVSAVILILAGLLVGLPMACPSHSEATVALKKGFCDTYVIEPPITNLVDVEPSHSGNAADDYVRAIEIYRDNEDDLEGFIKRPDTGPPPAVAEIVAIARDATTKKYGLCADSLSGSLCFFYQHINHRCLE